MIIPESDSDLTKGYHGEGGSDSDKYFKISHF